MVVRLRGFTATARHHAVARREFRRERRRMKEHAWKSLWRSATACCTFRLRLQSQALSADRVMSSITGAFASLRLRRLIRRGGVDGELAVARELRCAAAPECPDKGDACTAAEADGCRQPHLVVHSAPQERQLRALVQASQHTEAHRQRVDGLGVEPHGYDRTR